MGYSLFIARKYIGAGRRSAFLTAITVISVTGVAIGVLALIVVLAVLNGFESEVIERIIGTNAHIIVRKSGGGGGENPRDARGGSDRPICLHKGNGCVTHNH
jgi:lipoprotein-releasing system permease protein